MFRVVEFIVLSDGNSNAKGFAEEVRQIAGKPAYIARAGLEVNLDKMPYWYATRAERYSFNADPLPAADTRKRADRQRKYAAHQCRKTDKKDYSTIKENWEWKKYQTLTETNSSCQRDILTSDGNSILMLPN